MYVEVPVPEGRSGNWEVVDFHINENDAIQYNFGEVSNGTERYVYPGWYKKLVKYENGNAITVMSTTPAEINEHSDFLGKAKGNILVNGLGLGMCIFGLRQYRWKDVDFIKVIEIEEDVIKLVEPYLPKDKVEVVHADAFAYKLSKEERYDFVWHDIWYYLREENISEMTKLHRKYGRVCQKQASWGRDICKRIASIGF